MQRSRSTDARRRTRRCQSGGCVGIGGMGSRMMPRETKRRATAWSAIADAAALTSLLSKRSRCVLTACCATCRRKRSRRRCWSSYTPLGSPAWRDQHTVSCQGSGRELLRMLARLCGRLTRVRTGPRSLSAARSPALASRSRPASKRSTAAPARSSKAAGESPAVAPPTFRARPHPAARSWQDPRTVLSSRAGVGRTPNGDPTGAGTVAAPRHSSRHDEP